MLSLPMHKSKIELSFAVEVLVSLLPQRESGD